MVIKFIWEGKPAKVKYSAMINDFQKGGGLKLQDLETKVKSLHIKWIRNLSNKDCRAAWKEYVGTKFVNKQHIEDITGYNLQQNNYPNDYIS
jgi:hypothetical protein